MAGLGLRGNPSLTQTFILNQRTLRNERPFFCASGKSTPHAQAEAAQLNFANATEQNGRGVTRRPARAALLAENGIQQVQAHLDIIATTLCFAWLRSLNGLICGRRCAISN